MQQESHNNNKCGNPMMIANNRSQIINDDEYEDNDNDNNDDDYSRTKDNDDDEDITVNIDRKRPNKEDSADTQQYSQRTSKEVIDDKSILKQQLDYCGIVKEDDDDEYNKIKTSKYYDSNSDGDNDNDNDNDNDDKEDKMKMEKMNIMTQNHTMIDFWKQCTILQDFVNIAMLLIKQENGHYYY